MKSIDVYKHKFPITNHMCLWRAICILLSTRCRYIYHIYSIKWHIGWSKWKSLLVKWIFGKWLILKTWSRCKISLKLLESKVQLPKIKYYFSKLPFCTISSIISGRIVKKFHGFFIKVTKLVIDLTLPLTFLPIPFSKKNSIPQSM